MIANMNLLFPHIRQKSAMACGPTSLAIILKHYGFSNLTPFLEQELSISKSGTNLHSLFKLASEIGFITKGYQLEPQELDNVQLPLILHFEGNHLVVLYKISNEYYYISDPAVSKYKLKKDQFLKKWNGVCLELKPDNQADFTKIRSKARQANLDYRSIKFEPFLKYFRKYSGYFISLLFLSSILKLLYLSIPILLKFILDSAAGLNNAILFFLFAASLLILGLIGVSYYVREQIFLRLKFNFEYYYFSNLFEHIIKLKQSFFDSYKKEDIINRFQENTRLRIYFSSSLFDSAFNTFFILFYFFLILLLSSTSLFVALILVMVNVLIILLTTPTLVNADRINFYENNKNLNSFLDGLLGLNNLKPLNSENYFSLRWQKKYQSSLSNIIDSEERIVSNHTLLVLASLLAKVIFLFHSIFLLQNSSITFGDFVLLNSIFFMLLGSMDGVTSLRNRFVQVNNSIDRVTDFFIKEVEEDAENTIEPKPVSSITIDHLSFSYNQQDPVLKGINFTFKQGKKYGLVGENGCGKTTLVKLLINLYSSYEGKILLDDANDINKASFSYLRKELFYFPSEIYLFDDSIKNNLLIANPNASDSMLEQAIKLSNLDDIVDSFYLGMEHKIGDRGMKLSSGQRLKFGFARLFLCNPSVIILDEATSSLDPETEQKLLSNIYTYYSNKIIISVAHRIHTLKNFDEILVMKAGALINHGTHDQLLTKCDVYKKYIDNYS